MGIEEGESFLKIHPSRPPTTGTPVIQLVARHIVAFGQSLMNHGPLSSNALTVNNSHSLKASFARQIEIIMQYVQYLVRTKHMKIQFFSDRILNGVGV